MKRGKKVLSVVIAATMLLTMSPLPTVASKNDLDSKLLVHFDFESEAKEASDGTSYFQGTGAAAMFRGNPTIEQAEINGKSTNVLNLRKNNYLKLVNSADEDACNFLDEKEAFTITWWENNSSSDTSWAFWINRNGSAANNRRYLGSISRATAIRLEKQRGSNTGYEYKSASSGVWRHVAAVFEEADAKLYVNGELAGTVANANKLSDILQTNPKFYIGYAGWNEYATMSMDEFKIYEGALTADEIYYEYSGGKEKLAITEVVGGELDGSKIKVDYGTTVEELLTGITTNISGTTVTVYNDSNRTEQLTSGIVHTGSILVLSKEDQQDVEYSIIAKGQKIPTIGTETEDVKTFTYGAEVLYELGRKYGKDGGVSYNVGDELDGFDVVSIGNWGGLYQRLWITDDNASNLLMAKTTVRLNYSSENVYLRMSFRDENGNIINTNSPGNHMNSITDYTEMDLLGSNSAEGYRGAGILVRGGSELKGGCYFKDVTVTYKKTDADKALDIVVEKASQTASPTPELTEALEEAKKYKVSTAGDNMAIAATASQADIKAATLNVLQNLSEDENILKLANGTAPEKLAATINTYYGAIGAEEWVNLTDEQKLAVCTQVQSVRKPEGGYHTERAVAIAVNGAAAEERAISETLKDGYHISVEGAQIRIQANYNDRGNPDASNKVLGFRLVSLLDSKISTKPSDKNTIFGTLIVPKDTLTLGREDTELKITDDGCLDKANGGTEVKYICTEAKVLYEDSGSHNQYVKFTTVLTGDVLQYLRHTELAVRSFYKDADGNYQYSKIQYVTMSDVAQEAIDSEQVTDEAQLEQLEAIAVKE